MHAIEHVNHAEWSDLFEAGFSFHHRTHFISCPCWQQDVIKFKERHDDDEGVVDDGRDYVIGVDNDCDVDSDDDNDDDIEKRGDLDGDHVDDLNFVCGISVSNLENTL